MDPIVLIGFMGSGKTTLGKRLASALGVDFVDLDGRLEAEQGRSIGDLLRAGETAFRRLELQLLRQLLREQPTPGVVATGGGIVEIPEAIPLLRQLGSVVWLRADPQVCVARLGSAREARPLLEDETQWRRRYVRREPLYRKAAQWVVETGQDDIETCLSRLLHCLGSTRSAPADGA